MSFEGTYLQRLDIEQRQVEQTSQRCVRRRRKRRKIQFRDTSDNDWRTIPLKLNKLLDEAVEDRPSYL